MLSGSGTVMGDGGLPMLPLYFDCVKGIDSYMICNEEMRYSIFL